jgi:penicillin amidase/acyl-homoserine-lactone acylase
MFIEWDLDGQVSSTSIHNFGSATLDENSQHFADQSPIFVEMREKPVRFTLADLTEHAQSSYRPQDNSLR